MGTKATSTSCPNCGRRIELKPPYLCKMCGYSMIHKRCINYPMNIVRPLRRAVAELMTGVGASRDARVGDAASAESVAKRYLKSQRNVVEVKVFRIWPPKAKGVWEIDGIITIRRRVLVKKERFFLLQIDPETGDVINFKAPPLWQTIDHEQRIWADNHADAFREFLTVLDQIVAETKQSKFYPTEPVHGCGWSHEGREFIKGVLYAFLAWLESNAQFRAIMKKHELATDAAFEP